MNALRFGARVVALSALSASLVAGCSDDSDEVATPPADELLAPPAAGDGVQFKMITTLEPSSEVEHCQFFRAPPEGLNINHDMVRFTAGSHHVLLYLTPYEDIPTENDEGEPIDNSKPFDCSEGVTADWTIQTLIAGSQNSNGGSIVDFPPDVAMKVPGNAVLIMNAHYINANPEPVSPEVRVNVYTVPDDQVKTEGGLLFWYNPLIRVEAMGGGVAKMSCPIPEDITIRNAQSHMHARGRDYAAELVQADGQREKLYENTFWEGVPVKKWEEGLEVPGGTRIEYFCDYQNNEERVVWQGPKSTDEMCMFIASYYPARSEVSLCALDPEDIEGTQSLAAEWVGEGDSTCSDTLVCIQQIDTEDFLQGLTDCVLESKPSHSEVVSAGVRCLLTHADPAADCQPEIQACLAAE